MKIAKNFRLTLRRAAQILLEQIEKELKAQHRRYSNGAKKGHATRKLRQRAERKLNGYSFSSVKSKNKPKKKNK